MGVAKMGFIAAIVNLWWMSVYRESPIWGLLFLFVGLTSVWGYRKNKFLILFFILASLLVAQVKITKARSLTEIANDDRRLIDLRLSAYPPITFLPIAHWLEQKPITVASKRMAESLFENLDPNQYFFGNHPRERTGHIEIQKLIFIFLPFSLVGFIFLGNKHKGFLIINLFGLIILSYFGNFTQFGNIFLYPLLLISIDEGGRCIRKLC